MISNLSTVQGFLFPLGYSLDSIFCFWQIDLPITYLINGRFLCVESNQITFVVLFLYFMRLLKQLLLSRSCFCGFCFQSSKLNVNNMYGRINIPIKSVNGELSCRSLLWEDTINMFVMCASPILKTIFSYFKIYSLTFPWHCLVYNL